MEDVDIFNFECKGAGDGRGGGKAGGGGGEVWGGREVGCNGEACSPGTQLLLCDC